MRHGSVLQATLLVGTSLIVGCSYSTFVPDRAIVNAGKSGKALSTPADEPHFPAAAVSKPPAPLHPTETTLYWSSQGGDALDQQTGCPMAVIYYGHKEKMKEVERKKPMKVPILVLAKTIKDGRHECRVQVYDEPPPETLIYRLRISNVGSADYRGKLELVDELPKEIRYLGIKEVHDRHTVWIPYIGDVEAKSKVEGWHVDPPKGDDDTRVRWWIDDVRLKDGHWITVDIEFEPPPLDVVQVAR